MPMTRRIETAKSPAQVAKSKEIAKEKAKASAKPKASKPRAGDKALAPKPGIPIDKELIRELIMKYSGNLSRVADSIGTTRGLIRRKCDEDESLKQALADARERKIDELEEAVIDRAIRTNDTGIQCFLLKTQARHRGYSQDDTKEAAKEIATAAFEFIIAKAQANKPTEISEINPE